MLGLTATIAPAGAARRAAPHWLQWRVQAAGTGECLRRRSFHCLQSLKKSQQCVTTPTCRPESGVGPIPLASNRSQRTSFSRLRLHLGCAGQVVSGRLLAARRQTASPDPALLLRQLKYAALHALSSAGQAVGPPRSRLLICVRD